MNEKKLAVSRRRVQQVVYFERGDKIVLDGVKYRVVGGACVTLAERP